MDKSYQNWEKQDKEMRGKHSESSKAINMKNNKNIDKTLINNKSLALTPGQMLF
jgi:hypothetical protein